MTLAESIAKKLHGKKAGNGWVCCCPAHQDSEPSLSIGDAKGGGLVVHCFVGCDWRDVFAELRAKGLLDGSGDKIERPPRPRARPIMSGSNRTRRHGSGRSAARSAIRRLKNI